ncbi:hypothetical protein NUH16_001397 [Penicillium rubens]|nr:hypothetical protein NUH16_001397 [Penicillium rubens]
MFLGQLYSERLTGILVEFHGLIPATFVPILENLQQIQREGDLAFRKWVLPDYKSDKDRHNIPPPAYARKPGFIFPLTSIATPTANNVALDPSTPKSVDTLKLQTQTGLDYGQCQGLIAALTREYALIQGPPGTGKSYLGVKVVQALLEIKKNANLKPIIVMCYTNHALDQFLKHLLDIGIQKVIRIGSRSQAPELEGKNLRVVSKDFRKTKVESQTLGKSYGELEAHMEDTGYAMKPLHQSQKGLSWAAIGNFLDRPDLEGFTTVTDDKLLHWLRVKSIRIQKGQNEDEVDIVRLERLTRATQEDIHTLTNPERQILAMEWFKQWRESEIARIFEAIDHAASLRNDINTVHDEVNRRALIQADMIGITTTSLTRHIKTLRRLGSKVIICEEAAEIIEAHVISALIPGVKHFIQIGDHRQLRPQIQNYSLSLKSSTGIAWQLDRSQFKRRALGEPGLKPTPISQLNLDHQCEEDSRDNGSRVKSHSNQWEVDMATALIRHLIRQGEYKSTDIALLTPYTGQLRNLRTSLSKDFEICLSERDLETLAADRFEKVEDKDPESNSRKALEKKTLLQTLRLATVDNFQGEEAKVIVVSLVRSNKKRKVSFLRTENRINVLLSRA